MTIDLKSWMAEIDGKRDLFSLDIPGTHDCVTQFVQLPNKYQCQDKNIYEQLCMGVRALDIRVASKRNRLVMVHAITKAFNEQSVLFGQMDLSDVLEKCYRFLDENKSECIIFQFKNDLANEMEHCFDLLFSTYIEANKNYWYCENRIPTLDEARGKIVLIRRCKMDENNPNYTDDNTGIDFSNWVEQRQAVPEALELETHSKDNAVFIIQDRFKYKPIPRWRECIEPFLNSRKAFDGKYVICYFSTAGGPKGPKANAKFINRKFMAYPIDNDVYYGTIYLDFPFKKLTTKIILNNFRGE